VTETEKFKIKRRNEINSKEGYKAHEYINDSELIITQNLREQLLN